MLVNRPRGNEQVVDASRMARSSLHRCSLQILVAVGLLTSAAAAAGYARTWAGLECLASSADGGHCRWRLMLTALP